MALTNITNPPAKQNPGFLEMSPIKLCNNTQLDQQFLFTAKLNTKVSISTWQKKLSLSNFSQLFMIFEGILGNMFVVENIYWIFNETISTVTESKQKIDFPLSSNTVVFPIIYDV